MQALSSAGEGFQVHFVIKPLGVGPLIGDEVYLQK